MRTWARRALGGSVVLVLSAALFLGSGIDQAEAAVSYVPPPGPAVLGDTAAADIAEAGGVAVCDASIICGGALLAAGLGVALYDTRDTWMPWISNMFSSDGSTPGEPESGSHCIGAAIAGPAGTGGAVTWTFTDGCPSGIQTVYVSLNLVCAVGGGVASSSTTYTQNLSATVTFYGTSATQAEGCGSGTPVYAYTSNMGTDPSNWPTTLPTWGGGSDSFVNYQATVQCVASDGSTVDLSETTPGGNGGVTVPSCSEAGLGTHAKGITICASISSTCDAGTMIQTTPVSTPSQPACDIGSSAVCYWEVQVDGTPCLVGDARCQDWYSTSISSPSRVACLWGTYTMPVADCDFLRYAYQTGGGTFTTTGTTPITSGSSDTGGSTSSGGGASTTPATNPTIPDTSSGECFPSGWAAFNPVEWVLKPVECAMVWAFEPDSATLTTAKTTLSGDLGASGITGMFDAVGGLIGSLGGSGSGCTGPSVEFSLVGIDKTIYPFNACSDPMATAAAAVYALSTVTIAIWGGLALIRAVAAGFGFEFRMGGSKQDGD